MKRVRLLHVGALRLDRSFETLGVSAATGELLRRARQKVLEKVAQQAREWPADLIILQGSLFHSLPVRADTLSRTLDWLEQMAPAPIVILPDSDEVDHELSPWSLAMVPGHVTLFTQRGWHPLEHPQLPVTIHGKGVEKDGQNALSFDGLSLADNGHIHIAIASAPEGVPEQLPEAAAGLACLALDTEGPSRVVSLGNTTLSAVGTPQAFSFEDCGEKYMHKLEIIREADGSVRCQADSVPSSSLIFEKRRIDAADLATLLESKGDMLALPTDNLKRVLLSLEITGKKHWRDIADLTAFIKSFRRRLQHLEVEDHSRLDPDFTTLAGTDSLSREVAQQLLNRIRDCASTEDKERLEMSLHLLIKAVHEPRSNLKAEEFGEQ